MKQKRFLRSVIQTAKDFDGILPWAVRGTEKKARMKKRRATKPNLKTA